MLITLTRHSYSPTETMGYLHFPSGEVLHTMERPWIPDFEHGSKPFKSCVPDGLYQLFPHDGTDFRRTWALVNPDLKVTHSEVNRPGRVAIVFHVGNWVDDTDGCILPGTSRLIMTNPKQGNRPCLAVGSSGAAMGKLRELLHVGSTDHQLEISPCRGARM